MTLNLTYQQKLTGKLKNSDRNATHGQASGSITLKIIKKNVLVTEYKGLRDSIFLLRKIFDFLGIKTDEITIPLWGEATDVTHFQEGLVKEFLEVFSSSQLWRCNQIAPTDINKRFGWL